MLHTAEVKCEPVGATYDVPLTPSTDPPEGSIREKTSDTTPMRSQCCPQFVPGLVLETQKAFRASCLKYLVLLDL